MLRKMTMLAAGTAVLGALAAAAAVFVRIGAGSVAQSVPRERAKPLDLSAYPAEPPSRPLELLFIHHSCGGQLLAPVGRDVMRESGTCIYDSHPEGGDLRRRLTESRYVVHEASYGSVVGQNTDLFDWLPKFREQMPLVLATAHQDQKLPAGVTNQVVVFKSCFPNNQFEAMGEPPGNPVGPRLTVWNAKAALGALLPIFLQYPGVLFVYVTAPPIAPGPPRPRAYRWVLQKLRGQPMRWNPDQTAHRAELARVFNNWVSSPEGWLKGYALPNVMVFDNYDILAGEGRSNLLAFPTQDGGDSHPAREGNAKVAQAFVPFLNRAVRHAGIESR